MNPNRELGGVLPVLQTPFDESGGIDARSLGAEIDWVLAQGCDGVVVAMVSEIMRLDSAERRDLGELVCRQMDGRAPVVLSVGAESHRGARALARHAESVGAAAVMAVPPVLTALGDAQLLDYFEGLLDATTLPVIVQDASGYLGRPIPTDLQVELWSRHPERVLFKPEATPIGPLLGRLMARTGGKARVFEGTGGIALVDSHRRGVVGTMPAADVCWALRALWDALTAGDEERVDAIAGPLTRLISFQSQLDIFVAVEKRLLVAQSVIASDQVRGPSSFAWDDDSRHEVDHAFALLRRAVDGSGTGSGDGTGTGAAGALGG